MPEDHKARLVSNLNGRPPFAVIDTSLRADRAVVQATRERRWHEHGNPGRIGIWLTDFEQGGALFDRLRHEYFTLLAMPGDRDLSPVVEPLKRRFSRVLAVETLPRSNALSRRYGPSDGRLILVRPDGYIGFKCPAAEAHVLEETLQGMVLVP